MKVKQLHLQNYGRFEDLTIDFGPTEEKQGNVTVIVGNNGAGKSQILQALATGFSWFIAELKDSKGFEIENKLIKKNNNNVNIKITTDFGKDNPNDLFSNDKSSTWNIANTKEGRIKGIETNTYSIKATVKNFRKNLTHNERYSLPLVVFYPVERAILHNSFADILSSEFDQIDAYHACLDKTGIDFSDFLKWFRQQEDIENEMLRYASTDLKNDLNFFYEKENERKNLWKKYKQLNKSFNELNNSFEFKHDLQTLKQVLEDWQEYAENTEFIFDYAKNVKNSAELNQLRLNKLSSVKEALEYFTSFKSFHIRRQGKPTMIVEKDGEELDINQLSQGEKSLLALVGDIARRLAILNPSLDNPLEGKGVVMIDEVDLHLHPKWQHDLIDKLVNTFPNVQFILTTHSPHIISDRDDILLYALNDGEITQMPNVYGEDVNTVLTKIFDVDIRDSKVEAQFDDIRRAISHKKFNKAEDSIKQLAERLPSSNVELLKCRLMLAQAKLDEKKDSEEKDSEEKV